MRQLDWQRARDAVGLEVSVIIEESAQVVVDWARDAVLAHGGVITGESGREVTGAVRDDIGRPRPPP